MSVVLSETLNLRPEHCIACHRLILPGETYHQTAENTVLCQQCAGHAASFEPLDTVEAIGDLVVDVGEGLLRVRRGDEAVAICPGEVRHLVSALIEAGVGVAAAKSQKHSSV